MHYSGAVYRPPSEARSLIVQCTLGCSHNKCAFCTMYKDKKFSINPVEQVLSDLDEARAYGRYVEKIFLADGDALILPMDYLLTVLDYIRDHFPTCKRVAAYATTKAIMRKTDEELRTLREHGLGIVYIGLESGNEALLEKFCKGVTAEETVVNAIRCKEAGIATSGNYRNFHTGPDGRKYTHIIDPTTGGNTESNLLSATVVAESCTLADAMATMYMALGLEGSLALLAEHPEFAVLLIYADGNGEMKMHISPAMEQYM
jgi:hypothetical protein